MFPLKKSKKIIDNNKYVTTNEIKTILEEQNNVVISRRTISNRLKEMDYKFMTPSTKPPLTDEQMKNRLEWAQNHIGYDFTNVTFSDETSIWLRFNNKRWVNCNENVNDYDYISRYTIKLNIWAAISMKHESRIFIFTENLTGTLYENILKQNIKRFTDRNKNIVFQDDNDSKHRSKLVSKFKEENKIASLPWPVNSPDLNPIENIWPLLKGKVKKYIIKDIEQFKEITNECWKEITRETINNTILSMDNRVREVIKNKGGPINY